jgi:hypothetical protein
MEAPPFLRFKTKKNSERNHIRGERNVEQQRKNTTLCHDGQILLQMSLKLKYIPKKRWGSFWINLKFLKI